MQVVLDKNLLTNVANAFREFTTEKKQLGRQFETLKVLFFPWYWLFLTLLAMVNSVSGWLQISVCSTVVGCWFHPKCIPSVVKRTLSSIYHEFCFQNGLFCCSKAQRGGLRVIDENIWTHFMWERKGLAFTDSLELNYRQDVWWTFRKD